MIGAGSCEPLMYSFIKLGQLDLIFSRFSRIFLFSLAHVVIMSRALGTEISRIDCEKKTRMAKLKDDVYTSSSTLSERRKKKDVEALERKLFKRDPCTISGANGLGILHELEKSL